MNRFNQINILYVNVCNFALINSPIFRFAHGIQKIGYLFITKQVNQILTLFQQLIIFFSNMQNSKQLNNQEPTGEFLITISNKENEVIKFINQNQEIKCQKIINLKKNDQQLIRQIWNQLDLIKDYLQRKHSLKSILQVDQLMEIHKKQSKDKVILKITTRYWQYPTFEDFLRKESIHPEEQISRDKETIMHFIEEFFQLILQAGGIDYFFYTPRNLFIISPKRESYKHRFDKLILNFSSMAGLKLFINSKSIYREDFWEIYPLIPPNFYLLLDQTKQKKRSGQKFLKINTIIKKRAFAFLILCFLIKKVPDLIDTKKLDLLVSKAQIENSLLNSRQIFQKVLKVFQQRFKDAEAETGIKFINFFSDIFINPYLQINDKKKPDGLITWNQIYVRLFQDNLSANSRRMSIANSLQHQRSHEYFQKMLLCLWTKQKSRKYFLNRQFAVVKNGDKNSLIEGKFQGAQTMIYFLTKFNCNFHRVLKYPHSCMFICKENFTEDANQIVIQLISIFNQQEEKYIAEEEIKQIQVAQKVQIVEHVQQQNRENLKGKKEDSSIGKSNDKLQGEASSQQQIDQINTQKQCSQKLHLFNPFSLRNDRQMKAIKNQLKVQSKESISKNNDEDAFYNRIKSAPNFLSSIYSFRQCNKQTNEKEIISLSHKQVIISDFFSGLWKF